MPKSLDKTMSVLLCACLLIGMIAAGACAADHFPLKTGNVWVYYPSYGQGYRVDSIVGTEDVGGTMTYIWKRHEAPPDNYLEKRWLVNDGVNLEALQFQSNEMESANDPVFLDPVWPLGDIDNPTVGDSWVFETTIGTVDIKSTCWVESQTAKVTVPAGTFYNCIKVRQFVHITGSITKDEYSRYWLAPNVGPVRYTKYHYCPVNFRTNSTGSQHEPFH